MPKVVIIGAGLAGLACARVLRQRGFEHFVILEKQDGPGGRVRTDQQDGFLLDRGFQVLFTAYPTVPKILDLPRLDLCAYRPGAVLMRGGKPYLLGDPWRDWGAIGPSLLNPLVSFADKLRVLGLRWQLANQTPAEIFSLPDRSILECWQQLGFSAKIQEHFLKPFYQGILLDPDLKTSARLFRFYFKMLAEGSIVTPRLGLGQISQQLAGDLQPEQVRYNSEVAEILQVDGRASGVRLSSGERILAKMVVCAADAPAAKRLLQIDLPDQPRSVCCVYLAAPVSLRLGAYLYLNANGTGIINNLTELTQISPALAPPGQHLYSIVVLGDPELSDEQLAAQCRQELRSWFPNRDLSVLRMLRVYRIPFAQFAQPVGLLDQLPDPQTELPGLILAGEYTQHSSIEGSLQSGEKAAQLVLQNYREDDKV